MKKLNNNPSLPKNTVPYGSAIPSMMKNIPFEQRCVVNTFFDKNVDSYYGRITNIVCFQLLLDGNVVYSNNIALDNLTAQDIKEEKQRLFNLAKEIYGPEKRHRSFISKALFVSALTALCGLSLGNWIAQIAVLFL